MHKTVLLTLTCLTVLAVIATAAYVVFHKEFKPDRTITYRQIDGTNLSIYLFDPIKYATNKGASARPAILFYHGGAWSFGSPEQFYPWAQHFAELGWVAGSIQYRLNSLHGSDAFDAVEDARAAYSYLQQHAAELGIDPQRIVLAGGSAGGHLAATVAMTPWPERNAVQAPAALVLLNPALNTVYDDAKARPHLFADKGEQISPMHHVQPGLPPTLIVHGTEDSLVPITSSREFCVRMKEANNQCDVIEYEGVDHGFFNWGGGHYDQVLADVVNFTKKY